MGAVHEVGHADVETKRPSANTLTDGLIFIVTELRCAADANQTGIGATRILGDLFYIAETGQYRFHPHRLAVT